MRNVCCALIVALLTAPLLAQSPPPRLEVSVRELTVSGVTRLSAPEQQQLIREIRSRKYGPAQLDEITDAIVYAFQQRGYFKAHLLEPRMTVYSQDINHEFVDVTTGIDEGERYRLRQITFSGSSAFADGQLRSQFPIADGDVFGTDQIRLGLDNLRNLYASQGYVNFTPVPNTEADDETATISLKMDMDEGKQFRFGALILDGVESQPGTSAKLIEAWKPYEGKIYDPKLVKQYWSQVAELLPPGFDQEKSLGMKQDGPSARVFPLLELPQPK